MAVVARASRGYAVRILIMVGLCAAFAIYFAYDGWVGYPANDDVLIKYMWDHPSSLNDDAAARQTLKAWPGYNQATPEQIAAMALLVEKSRAEGWKGPWDIRVQQLIVVALALATLATAYFFYRYTRKRAIADDAGLSPAIGSVIPWENITKIDNTQWDKKGIVTVTYKDAAGAAQTAVLDDYDLENLPAVLDEVANRALHAEFDPPLASNDAPAAPAQS